MNHPYGMECLSFDVSEGKRVGSEVLTTCHIQPSRRSSVRTSGLSDKPRAVDSSRSFVVDCKNLVKVNQSRSRIVSLCTLKTNRCAYVTDVEG